MLGFAVPDSLNALPAALFVFLAVFARVGAAVAIVPGFGEMTLNPRVKLMIALALAAALTPAVETLIPAMPGSSVGIVMLIVMEMLFGLALGALIRLFMGTLQLAGNFIAMQTGLGMAQNFDPTLGVQGAMVGALLALTATTLIFVTDLHHVIIAAVRDSYVLFPPATAFPADAFADLATQTVAKAFFVAMQMAMPFIAFGLIFYLSVGVLSRLIPQVQIFFLAMPLNVLAGFFVLSLVFGIMMTWFIDRFSEHLMRFLA